MPPLHTRNPSETHEHAIHRDADQTDRDHLDDQEIGAQSIAGIHYREAKAITTGDHLRGHNNQPGESGCDAQCRNHLRHDGGQGHLHRH